MCPKFITPAIEIKDIEIGSVLIPLRSRKYPNLFAVIDADDVPLISGHRWWAKHNNHIIYAYTQVDKKTVHMHQMIMQPDKGTVVDHINHNGLDNRRANLRMCSQSRNMMNRGKLPSNNTTGFTGVEKLPNGRYRARIWRDRQAISGGLYASAVEAAIARDELARKHFGVHGTYNFPLPGEEGVADV